LRESDPAAFVLQQSTPEALRPMTVALVAGAGGFVGGHLCRHLERSGVTVRRLGRHTPVGVLEPSEARRTEALAGVDVVFYLAAIAHERVAGRAGEALQTVNVDAPLNWLRAAERAGARRFVWLSSIKVLGDVSAEPLRPDAPYRPGDAYARSKQAAERALLGEPLTRTSLAVVRPPLVYGPGVRGNFLALLRWAESRLPLPLGRATAPRSLLGIGNLCDLLLRLEHDGDGVFHVADPTDVCVAELVRQVRRLLHRPPRLMAVPATLLRRAARLVGRAEIYARLFEPLRVDGSATCASLNWSPPLPPLQELEETVAWFRSSR
jgi:nucleoside-diphosphate-sugar epimerase